MSEATSQLHAWLDQARQDDADARNHLLEHTHGRLSSGTYRRAVIRRNNHGVADKLAESLLHNQSLS